MQIREWGENNPLSAVDICTLENDLDLDEDLAAELLVDYYSDSQTIKIHYCLTCGERLDGTVTEVGQALLAHQVYHQHIEVLDQIDREEEYDT